MDRYKPLEIQKKWSKKWDELGPGQYDPKSKNPIYSLDNPPPYPTGRLHMGHVLNWCYMDFAARYKRLTGHNVYFPQGWDCHGLPTEVKVEEIHKIRKNDVPRDEFRKMCVDLITENISKMTNQMKSMGFSIDWDYGFITMQPEYYMKTQLSFLKFYEKDLIYRKEHPVNWCPRCETAIAFAEIEYKDRNTLLNFLKFKDEKGEDVIIATTRPELLCACVAVAVNPKDPKRKDLIGKKLKVPLYDLEAEVIGAHEVDPEFGTGIVMICTFGDKSDVNWTLKNKLRVIKAIDPQGKMTAAAGKYEGMGIKECQKAIIEDLKKKGLITKQDQLAQSVGTCWRCKTPIEILSNEQWFVKASALNEDVKKKAAEMKWFPPHMKLRLEDWVDNMDWDWVISRQRIFATPFPLWYCAKCGEVVLAEEKELPVDPTKDKPKKKCKCGSDDFIPERDVMDTWMDSSITPLTYAGWPDLDERLYPSTVRPQGHDIIKTWAYYTTLRCPVLTGKRPFDEVLINGMVQGEDGKKMSKSRNNFVELEEVVGKFGPDAIRQWAAYSVPGSDIPFAWKDVEYSHKFLNKFWNAARFSKMHLEDYDGAKPKLEKIDKWVLGRLYQIIEKVTKAMDEYEFINVITPIQKFVWHDFCDNYIEFVKYRLYSKEKEMAESREAAQYVLNTVIMSCLKLLAPFTPFFSEEVYSNFSDKESIFFEEWPKPGKVDEKIVESGDALVEVVSQIRKWKSSKNLPMNSEIKEAKISGPKSLKELEKDLKGAMNIEKVVFTEGDISVKI